MKKQTSKLICLLLALVLTLLSMTGSAAVAFADDGGTEAQTETRITYTGKTAGFFKEDGASEFGMLSFKDGSRIVVDQDQVKIYAVPSNRTIYDGIHWGFITDETLSKDVTVLDDGCWIFTVGTENCGYGLPAAPVKKKDGGTTSAQYYLCIPAEEELDLIADYSRVDEALASVPEDLSIYTEDSAKAVDEAVAATKAEDFRFYSMKEQAAVDAAAEAIEHAVAGLEYRTEEPQDEGIVPLAIYDEELMFKVVNAYLETSDGKTEFVFCLSAKGYEDIFAGTYDEAIANGSSKENWTHYAPASVSCIYETKNGMQDDGVAEKYQFRVPVKLNETGTTRIPITAISHSRMLDAEKADPENPDYSGAFTARQALIDPAAKTVRTGNYQDTLEAAVTSSIESMHVEAAGEIFTIGTPQANEYTRQAVFTLSDTAYDAYFKGDAQTAASEDAQITEIGEDRKVVLRYLNSLGKAPEIDITTGKVTVAFRVAETQEWIDREIVIDPEERAITISGGEIAVEKELKDGTYKASVVTTDVHTAESGMIVVAAADVVIRDGQATAIVTMKGTGVDRLYVSDTATQDTIIDEAVAEEQKEVSGKTSALLGGVQLPGSSAYTFWPVPVRLGEPKLYAARSARHFSRQDAAPKDYYYVHDFQIDEADLTYVSDSTDIMTPEINAEKYISQFFMDGKVTTDHTAVVSGKGTDVKIPYYDGEDVIKSIELKRRSVIDTPEKYVFGWILGEDAQACNSVSASNWRKRFARPDFDRDSRPFTFANTVRTEGGSFKGILAVYPEGTKYDANPNNNGMTAAPLATKEFTFTIEKQPQIDFNVRVSVIDAKTKEVIENPTVTVRQNDAGVIEPAEGVYVLNSLRKYTVSASAEGYTARGGAAEVLAEDYAPKKEETLTLELLKEEDSRHTVVFDFVDQNGEAVVNPVISVTRDGEAVEAESDGSYQLYDGINYRYTVTAEGYEDKTYGSITPSEDLTETVRMNKYLQNHTVYFKVRDSKTSEALTDASVVVMLEDGTYAEINEDGSFTVADGQRISYTISKEDYTTREDSVTVTGFDEIITYYPELTFTNIRQLRDEIAAAQAFAETIVVSEQPRDYPAGTKEALIAAIQDAQLVAADEASSEDACSAALKALTKAESVAKEAQNPDKVTVRVRVHDAIGSAPTYMQLDVTGDTAAKLKYRKPADLRKNVTFFDVVVAVHEAVYKEAFRNNPSKYLEQDSGGLWFIARIFGETTSGTVRSLMKINEGYVDYTGYYKRVVSENDLVTVGVCADKARYLYFGELEKSARKGIAELSLFEGNDSSSKDGAPASGYEVTFTNENGASTSAVADENGKLRVIFKEQGVYEVTAAVKDGVTSLIPYVRVTVLPEEVYSEEAAEKEKEAVEKAIALLQKAEEIAGNPESTAKEVEAAIKAAEEALGNLEDGEQRAKVEAALEKKPDEILKAAKDVQQKKADAEKKADAGKKSDAGKENAKNPDESKTPSSGKASSGGKTPSGAASAKAGVAVGTSFNSGKLSYKVTKAGEVTLLKNGNKKAKKVTVPATVSYQGQTFRVTAIADKAFANNRKLKQVIIGKNVAAIGKKAFKGDKKLKKITFKGVLVKKVGRKAFSGINKKAAFKAPKKALRKYRKLIRKAGAPKGAKYKK